MHHTRNAVTMLEALFPTPEIHGAIFRQTLPYPRKQIVAPLVQRYDVSQSQVLRHVPVTSYLHQCRNDLWDMHAFVPVTSHLCTSGATICFL